MRLTFLLLLISSVSFGQLSLDRQVASRVQKGKWKSAEELLIKALRKDTLSPEARYEFSKLYLNRDNPSFHIDSAYFHILAAIRVYGLISEKEKDHLLKFPLDTNILIRQRQQVDSAAFERSKSINTENSYNEFISRFTTSSDLTAATELRNEVAFLDALKRNTHQAFLEYLNKYPNSLRVAESRNRYEKLLFEDLTREGTLASFGGFYKKYPASPFAIEAMKNIFEISTASGLPADFIQFIHAWPETRYSFLAKAMLYHLLKEEDSTAVEWVLTDSLKAVQQEEEGYWVPILRNGKFGFINNRGMETVTAKFETIKPEYICGNIREDYLIVAEGIISRSGNWIFHLPVLEAQDAGAGFLKVNTGSCTQFVHKSGFVTGDCVEDVKLIGHRFIAYRDHLKWGVMTLTGRKLEDARYDDVLALDQHVVFVKSGKKMIVKMKEVAAVADKHPLPTGRVFDDVQRLATGSYLVRNGSLEGVLDDSLEFTVPLYRQNVVKTPLGFQLQRGERYSLTGVSDHLQKMEFTSVNFYGDWIKLLLSDDLRLFDYRQGLFINTHLDSVKFEKGLAFAWKADSVSVYLKSGERLPFPVASTVNFVSSIDSSQYFVVTDKARKTVFDAETGLKLFTYAFDDIAYWGRGIFVCTVGSKKGLLSDKGKVLLPIEYNALVRGGTETISLLKDKKFGLYSLRTRKFLKADYERNVLPVSSKWLVAYKEGAYGFVGWDGKPLGKFEFDEVRPWNDTTAMVRKNFQWMVYSIENQKPLVGRIKDYRLIGHSDDEMVVLIHQENFYGVLSNRKGEIIPATFSDIINVGSEEEPMYFVEKSVEEAGIYVVIYYDHGGKFLRKQVYESDEYERIYCSEK